MNTTALRPVLTRSARRGYTLLELLLVLLAPAMLVLVPAWLTMLFLGAFGTSVGYGTMLLAAVATLAVMAGPFVVARIVLKKAGSSEQASK